MKNMKIHKLFFAVGFLSKLLFTSCEDFLDKSPDQGLNEEDVYKDYNSIRGFMDEAYSYLENFHSFDKYRNGRSHIGAISDELASLYNSTPTKPINSGNWLSQDITDFEIGNDEPSPNGGNYGGTSIWMSYKGIRIVSRVIQDIDKVPNLSDTQKNEILGQAHFLRAWFYFNLIRRYGGMPIFDTLFMGDGDEDRPRQTYHGSHDWMMTDIEAAISMLPDVWDASNTGRATRIAAMALKEMAQLYDASPLMQNDLSSIQVMEYDKSRAAVAAKSAWDLINYINTNPQLGYGMMDGANYKHIFYWSAPPYTQKEYLWYNRSQGTPGATYNKNEAFTRQMRCLWIPGRWADGTGNDAMAYNAPTQNMVDLFEKEGSDGLYYPIDDPNAGYNPQDPYADRDPRLHVNIILPGEKWGVDASGKTLYYESYIGGLDYDQVLSASSTDDRSMTGYACKKFMWEGADAFTKNFGQYRVITVFIRMAQVYLDFAEASFEATGSATARVDGCEMSALEAINVVRERAGIGEMPSSIYSDPQKFREAYRRERGVELMFENNRWWDLRRWMIAHEVFDDPYPIKGIRATPVNPDHTSVADKSTLEFTYEVVDLIPEQRVFEMRNYWYPFSMNDVASLNNLVQNPGW